MNSIITETIQRTSSISFPGLLGGLSINPPSYFTIFGKPIYFYGLIIGLAFIVAILYCSHISGEFGLKEDDIYDLMIWMIPLSILGARLYYVLFNLDYYVAYPSKILSLREGGLAIYGGIIAGIITIYCVCRRKKVPVRAMLDLVVLGLMIGQAMGRWGNFMNREAFGAETDIFCRMGLTSPSGNTIYVHPTFLYESLWNICGFIFIRNFAKKEKRSYDGQLILMYFFWYGLGRFWIEGLRTDSLYIGSTGIRVSQLLSAVLSVSALVALLVLSRKKHSPDEVFVNRVRASEVVVVSGPQTEENASCDIPEEAPVDTDITPPSDEEDAGKQ